MTRVAGVSGAGPLWNRIMLHLYEHRDPPHFVPPPKALLEDASRTAKIARTSSVYDEWRLQQSDTRGPLRILFPHDGDIFEDNLQRNDTRRTQQQIAFRISRPGNIDVMWMLNGKTVARGKSDAYFWTVRQGAWTLDVSSGGAPRRVHFVVVGRRAHGKRGFAVTGAD